MWSRTTGTRLSHTKKEEKKLHKLKIEQITRVFVNTDPTWSMTYCYMKYTGDCTGIA